MWRSLGHVYELDNLVYRGPPNFSPRKTITKPRLQKTITTSRLPQAYTRPIQPASQPSSRMPMDINNRGKRSLNTACINSTDPLFQETYCKKPRVSPTKKRIAPADLAPRPNKRPTLPAEENACVKCLTNNGWDSKKKRVDNLIAVNKAWCKDNTMKDQCLTMNPKQWRMSCKNDATIIYNKDHC